MSICSLVVYTKPQNLAPVEQALVALEGVEIHATDPNGRVIVTVDHPDRTQCSETIMGMAKIDGVINTALVYEYME
ncbi:MAG: chaperone NapD [Hyphomicrobiales bacterium]|nr:chaperone NapD [Hyphomicrobiales bacterium]